MSKIGRKKISIKSLFRIHYNDGSLMIEGKYGKITSTINNNIILVISKDYVKVFPKANNSKTRELWGSTRSLIKNMIIGVTKRFKKVLEVHGIGYRISIQNDNSIAFSLGYSHDIIYYIPYNISLTVDKNTIEILGIDNQLVGQVSSEIRNMRKPEKYKGKGIRYSGEYLKIKERRKK